MYGIVDWVADGLRILFKLNKHLNVWVSLDELTVRMTWFGVRLVGLTWGGLRPDIRVKQLEEDESKLESVAVEQIMYEFTPEATGAVQFRYLYHVVLSCWIKLDRDVVVALKIRMSVIFSVVQPTWATTLVDSVPFMIRHESTGISPIIVGLKDF